MKDLKNAGKFYAHYLKPYWIEFLITTILVGISTWAIVVAPTYMGRAIEELATYVQQWMNQQLGHKQHLRHLTIPWRFSSCFTSLMPLASLSQAYCCLKSVVTRLVPCGSDYSEKCRG